MRSILLAALVALGLMAGGLAPVAAQESGQTMIIMDGSGSMWGRIGKQPKLKIAKRAVNQFLKRLPDDLEVGLMAYGHRREGDCDDIQVLVKPGAGTDRKIGKALAGMKFLGKTPIASSLREAAEALDFEDKPVTVILVTDGTESCRANPCEVAADLEAEGYDFTAHVVGFGLKSAEGRRLTCIANRTGGKYYPAKNARALARALEAAMSGEDTAESEAFAESEPEADPANGTEVPEVSAEPIPGVAYYRGAPVMLNAVLNPVGNVGIVAQAPRAQSFPPDGQISDCQATCEGEPLCAAWRFDPKGATAAGTAICTMFDYAAALDYADVDPTAGYASGMKVAAVQLVRPYVPAPVVAVADAEMAAAPVDVTLSPTGGPEGLSVFWQVIPLNDPEGFGIAGEGTEVGPWTVELTPGEYAVEGTAEGWFFEGYIQVAADATSFPIEGVALGEDVAVAEDAAEDVSEEPAEEGTEEMADGDEFADVNDVEEMDDGLTETTNTQPMNEPTKTVEEPVIVATVDPGQTLALGGVGTVSPAGYRCDADQACGFQHAETGLVFALPPGWGSDTPAPAAAAEGQTTDLLAMTFFGPEGADGSLPTLLLNPLGWTAANGSCVETGAGPLCVWGATDAALQAGIDQIAPSLTVAAVAEDVAAEEPATEEMTTEEPVTPEVVEPAATDVTEPASTDTEANEPGLASGPSANPGNSNPGTADAATEEPASTEVTPTPVGSGPTDGNWAGKADAVTVTQCPAGFETALDPILANLTAARPITWGGVFDANALGLPGMVWQPADGQTLGDAPPAPVEGLPPFILGVMTATATMTDADNVTGTMEMTFFADGYGTVGLLNAGLQACRLGASFALTRTN